MIDYKLDTYFAYSEPVRKIIYTTNTVEGGAVSSTVALTLPNP